MTAGEIGLYCPSCQHLVFVELANHEKPKDNRVNSAPNVFGSKLPLSSPITHWERQGQSVQRKCTQSIWKDSCGHLKAGQKANQEDSKMYRRGRIKNNRAFAIVSSPNANHHPKPQQPLAANPNHLS